MYPFTTPYPSISADRAAGKEFDYVIIGGGTAGALIASRLSEDNANNDPTTTTTSPSVLLLERGHVKDNFLSRIPLLSQNYRFPFLQVVSRLSEPITSGIVGEFSPGFGFGVRDEKRRRRATLWTAEGLGGATRINGTLLTRGIPAGYDQWRDSDGLTEWGWDSVEPFFKRGENAVSHHPDAKHRGHDGPIEVRKPREASLLGCIPYVDKAAQNVGLSVYEDVNDPAAGAQGIYQMDQTIDAKGTRLSAYAAWLPKRVAMKRKKHLKICTGVVATKLVVSSGGNDGTRRVTGVKIRDRKTGCDYTVRARREVIIACGTLCTPQLLMLSGIGPRRHLKSHGIKVIKDLPAVGQNLSDHTSVPIMAALPRKHTLHMLENGLFFLWQLVLYLFWGTGLLTIGSTTRTIFFRTSALDTETMAVRRRDDHGNDTMDPRQPSNIPDTEIMINPVNCLTESVPGGKSLFTWYTTLVQPFSRGRVELSSTNPEANPKIIYPMLTDDQDLTTMRTATRFGMRLAEEFAERTGYPHPAPLIFAPGMDLNYLDSIYTPKVSWWNRLWKKDASSQETAADAGPDAVPPAPGIPAPILSRTSLPTTHHAQQAEAVGTPTSADSNPATPSQARTIPSWKDVTDSQIDAYAARVCVSALHLSTTCRMSTSPATGVVDQHLKVHGFSNLRIADASVFPRIPSAHTMAPVVMVAERCAEFVKQEWSERKTR